ncbi:MAG: hypothetical protein SV375_18635, partial [Thermodesulfobacteriota bacterium]|nr:hypothetical protein [Thermodesulfobacteriota bacterium]
MFIELIPWRPFGRELGTLRKEVDDLFSRFFGEFPLTRKIAEEWAPRVDVSETNDKAERLARRGVQVLYCRGDDALIQLRREVAGFRPSEIE